MTPAQKEAMPPGWVVIRPLMFGQYLMAKRDEGWATLFISKPDEQENWVSEKPIIQLHSSCLAMVGKLFPEEDKKS